MYSPFEVAKSFIEIGHTKAKLSIGKLLILGFLAGLFISITGVGATAAAVTIDNATVARILSAAVFPGGLVMVIVVGAELFTGNSLMIISTLEKKITFIQMLKNWLFVYIGNFIGSLFVALLVVYGHTASLYDGKLAESMVNIAAGKVNLTLSDAFIRAILCNILVCVAVWVAAAAKNVSGKIVALYLPIFVFVLCGYEHCVANMYYIPVGIFASSEYGIAAESLNWGSFILKNLIPVTLGNIVGGCFIGTTYWAAYLKNADNK